MIWGLWKKIFGKKDMPPPLQVAEDHFQLLLLSNTVLSQWSPRPYKPNDYWRWIMGMKKYTTFFFLFKIKVFELLFLLYVLWVVPQKRCVFFIYSSCYLCFPVSVRQNKRKIGAMNWIVSTSIVKGVSRNGRDCKRKVTEACY